MSKEDAVGSSGATSDPRIPLPARKRTLGSFVSRTWHVLRSMTFAIVMLLAILCIVIAGSFLPQDNGIRLVYESWWFYALNILLMLSIVSCVSRRVKPVWRYSFAVPVAHRPEFYRAGDTATALVTDLDVERAVAGSVRALRALHYRVEVVHNDGRSYLIADRFRIMRLGTLISHLSIVLMVATIAWGSFAGWLDRSLALEAGGPAIPIGHGTGLVLRSDSFDFGLYADGTPRDFKDHLTIIENDGKGPAHHDVIDVNTPWYYGGIFGYDVHQADYGIAARLLVFDRTKKQPTLLPYCLLQFSTTPDCTQGTPAMLLQPLGDGSYTPAGTSLSAFYLPDQNLAVTISFHDAVPKDKLVDTVVVTVAKPPQRQGQQMQIVKEAVDISMTKHPIGELTDHPIDIGNMRIAVWVRREAFVNVGHNPAVPFIFTSFGLILLGLVSVLYFPFSRLWLYVGANGEERAGTTVLLRGSADKSRQGFKRRFATITKRIERELGVVPSDKQGKDFSV